MTPRHSLPSGDFCCRVLGLVLTPRWGGSVVVDGFGIAPVPNTPAEMRDSARRTSFRAVCLRTVKTTAERSRWIERHLAKVIREHAPTVAVLGFHRNEARDHPALQKIAARVLGEHGIPVVERRIEDVRELMLGRLRGGRPNHLPETLTTSFFPELRAQLHLDIEKRRYEANAWNALSLAVAELAERKPSSALALLQPGAAIPPAFHELLTRAADNFRG